jgi:HAD superfamily hydrolase (TIGR01549 family)
MIRTVFFDFGGTLFYEKRKVPEEETLLSGYKALKEWGLQVPFEVFMDIFQIPYRQRDRELAEKGLEINTKEFTRQIMPELGMDPKEEAIDSFIWGRFQPHSVNDEMYDDVLPTLKELKPGTKVGLISNAQPHGILWYLDKTGIVTYFDEVIISGAVGLQKPNPRIFRLAAESICSPPEECMMVGDSPSADAAGSQAVGMTGVVVDRSGRLKQSFPHLNVVTDLRDILKWLK